MIFVSLTVVGVTCSMKTLFVGCSVLYWWIWILIQFHIVFLQVKRKYRIAPTFSDRRRVPSTLFLQGRHGISQKVERNDFNMPTRSQIDIELAKMRTMTSQEAAIAAAQAVAEAEAAIAEAEEAAMEAEAAEADAEAAQAFAEAAMKTLKGKHMPMPKMVSLLVS